MLEGLAYRPAAGDVCRGRAGYRQDESGGRFHTRGLISGASVARGQSVEGFGGKEVYYPLLEAIGQLTRGAARGLVIETLSAHAPMWLMQFPSLVQPNRQAALQREILGATRDRMVRELPFGAATPRTRIAVLHPDGLPREVAGTTSCFGAGFHRAVRCMC